AGLSHQTSALPGQAQPKAAILIVGCRKIDDTDEVAGPVFEADGPDPLFATFHSWQCYVAEELERTIGGVWARDFCLHIAHDFPMREKLLYRRRIRKLERAQNEAGSL